MSRSTCVCLYLHKEILEDTKETNNGYRGEKEDPEKGGMGDTIFAVDSFLGRGWGGMWGVE